MTNILQDLVVSSLTHPRATPREKGTEWVIMILSVLLAAAGICFLVLALNKYLMQNYTADMAELLTAGALFMAAILAVVFARCLRCSRRAAAPQQNLPDELTQQISSLIEQIGDELAEPIKDSPKTALMVAAIAGFITARYQDRL